MLEQVQLVVYQVKDTIFWKQITTVVLSVCFCPQLFIKSKIQFFESKSQHNEVRKRTYYSCLSSQRYNFLKANHNTTKQLIKKWTVVYQVKDTIFWKQITTKVFFYRPWYMLFIKSKIQFFESKSQLYIIIAMEHIVVYQVKDTIFWKQITTQCKGWRWCQMLFIKSKIQFFESKSQLQTVDLNEKISCLSSQRYNFLKANHNTNYLMPEKFMLFIKSKIQFFESKSQQPIVGLEPTTCCLSSQRYNFLKANHNGSRFLLPIR